jgi:hypothetical protein
MNAKSTNGKKLRIFEGLRDGLSISDVCDREGISRTTFYRWKLADPDFVEELDRIEVAKIERSVINLLDDSNVDWRLAAFLLASRFPDEWGNPVRRLKKKNEEETHPQVTLDELLHRLNQPFKTKDAE